MTIDLTVLDVAMEVKMAVARFYVEQTEAFIREGVDEWIAREEARKMATSLLLYAVETDEGPFPGL